MKMLRAKTERLRGNWKLDSCSAGDCVGGGSRGDERGPPRWPRSARGSDPAKKRHSSLFSPFASVLLYEEKL